MGLSAAIACNCFREGTVTSPPPFPSEWLLLDGSGVHLVEEHDSRQNQDELWRWRWNSCPHNGNHYFDICGWPTFRKFGEALEEIGWQAFPTLVIPFNDQVWSETPTTACEAALKEIDYFLALGQIGSRTVLVEEITGEVVYERLEAYQGELGSVGKPGENLCYGLDEFEFFCRHRETGETLFRATRFRQITNDGAAIANDGSNVIWQNSETNATFAPGTTVSRYQDLMPGESDDLNAHFRITYPSELYVDRRALRSDDFDYLLTRLKKAYQKAIETGNDIHWVG